LSNETTGTALTTTAGAQAELAKITAAISTVAANRGNIGAAVNQLNATQGVEGAESTNLTSAVNSVENADIGQVVAQMTQNSVLEQTGMAALSQANQIQQTVLKLLQ
jgi:flagellin